jgi:MFS family permease
VITRVVEHGRRAFGALRDVFVDTDLRRLELGYVASSIGQWTTAIAVSVFAFDVGGAPLVALAIVTRTVPAALAAPLASTLGDRFPRVRVLVVSDLVRAAAVSLAALTLMLQGPPAVVFVLSAIVSVVSTVVRPARAALLPSLVRRPEQLAAANVVFSSTDALSVFVGPALGGLLLAATDFEWVLAAAAASLVWSALLVARIHPASPGTPGAQKPIVEPFLRAARRGFGAIRESATAAIVVGSIAAQMFVDGALGVVLVVLAFDVLGTQEAGVGFLNSAVGAGGVVGALVALLATSGRRLAVPFGAGLFLWGFPVAVVGVWPSAIGALVMMVVLGVGNTLVDVAGFTLLQRTVPDEVLARVFGVLEAVGIVSMALGAALTSVAIEEIGIESACLAVGVILPALALACSPALARIDRRSTAAAHELELLRRVDICAPLEAETLKDLASRLRPLTFPPGGIIVEPGTPNGLLYLIDEGAVDVAVDGRAVHQHRAGDHFGEIALLQRSSGTATVTARDDWRRTELSTRQPDPLASRMNTGLLSTG